MKKGAIVFILIMVLTANVNANIDPVKFLVARLDYSTYDLKHLYYFEQPYQAIFPADEESIHHDMFVHIVPAGDFGETTIRCRTTGEVVYYAKTIWMGTGQHIFPPSEYEIFETDSIENRNLQFVDFDTSFFFVENDWLRADSAWRMAMEFAPLSRFNDEHFGVLSYLHYFTLGMADPSTAEWIIIFYTTPNEIPEGKWQNISQFFPDQHIHDVNAHFAFSDTVYTTTRGGAFKSFDGGEVWQKIEIEPEIDLNVTALAATPNPWVDCLCEVIYLGTEEYTMIPEDRKGRVIRSWIDGVEWEDTKFPDKAVTAIGLNPANPRIAYAASYNPFYYQWGLYKLASDTTWTKILPEPADSRLIKGNCIKVNPKDTNAVYVGSDHGLFLSTDGGISWAETLNHFTISAIDFYEGLILVSTFGQTRSDGIYASEDNGKSWRVWCYWLYCSDFIVTYPFNGGPPYFYLADSARGVFGTRAPGYNWRKINEETTLKNVTCLSAGPAKPTQIFAGSGEGLFKYTDISTGITRYEEKVKPIKTRSLIRNYPNPFNNETRINYSVPSGDAHVTLKIYNFMGQQVTILVNELKTMGEYTIVWRGGNSSGKRLPSGIYFISFEVSGLCREVIKAVLLK